MSDGKIAQTLQNNRIVTEITCPQTFAMAQKARVFSADLGGYCTSHTIRIHGCQTGCFR
ncbi:MAG: hypothetical protein ACYDEZ_06085 [Methanoregula sp.]|jgi:hypothetical protein